MYLKVIQAMDYSRMLVYKVYIEVLVGLVNIDGCRLH